jgi:hypothetical protein
MASSEVEKCESSSAAAGSVDKERRNALRQMAKFGAYTAPALLVMLSSEQAVAADSVIL